MIFLFTNFKKITAEKIFQFQKVYMQRNTFYPNTKYFDQDSFVYNLEISLT